MLVYVGLDLVGDGLIKLPFVRALRAAYPDARITWLAGKGRSVFAGALAPLVAHLLDEVVDDAGIGSRWIELFGDPLARTPLAGRRFDLVIDTQRRLLTTLIARRIPHRTFVSGAADFRLSDRKPPAGYRRPAAMIRQVLDLIAIAGGAVSEAGAVLTVEEPLVEIARALLPGGPPYVGLAPGAGGRHKCWPLDRFIALARLQSDAGRVPVFVLGPDEAAWADGIRAAVPGALLPLQTPAVEALGASPPLTHALGRRLVAAVANDSGAGHMLAAADIPLVSLFGPTPPEKFAPFVASARVIRAQDFGAEAMTAIPVETVAAAVESLLADVALGRDRAPPLSAAGPECLVGADGQGC